MKVLDECSSDKVCAEVQISAANLWTIMHRARLQVRECVEKKNGFNLKNMKLKRILIKIMDYIMLDCKSATLLVTKKLDGSISFWKCIRLKMHL